VRNYSYRTINKKIQLLSSTNDCDVGLRTHEIDRASLGDVKRVRFGSKFPCGFHWCALSGGAGLVYNSTVNRSSLVRCLHTCRSGHTGVLCASLVTAEVWGSQKCRSTVSPQFR